MGVPRGEPHFLLAFRCPSTLAPHLPGNISVFSGSLKVPSTSEWTHVLLSWSGQLLKGLSPSSPGRP